MNRLRHKVKPLLIMLLAVALLFSLVAPAWAQEDAGENDEEALTCDHPILAQVVSAMVAAGQTDACTVVLGYVNQGVGLGQILKAWYLSQSLSEGQGDLTTWQELLDMHLNDEQGWGEVMFAYRFAAALADSPNAQPAEELLRLKTEEGLGWGKIRQVIALADAEFEGSDADLTYDQALVLIQEGTGWGEIREGLGLEPGAPPWAGKPPWAGPPPWAGKPGNDGAGGEELENGDESGGPGGPPPFAGPPGQNRGNGNGPGNGRGNGNGNGNGNGPNR